MLYSIVKLYYIACFINFFLVRGGCQHFIEFFLGAGLPKIFEIFPGKGGVAKISKFRGHFLSSGHQKNQGG